MAIKTKTAALSLGLLAALMHAVWGIIVAVGAAQPLVEWKLGLHFMKVPYTLGSFDAVTWIMLIVMSFISGTIIGGLFAMIWNWAEKKW